MPNNNWIFEAIADLDTQECPDLTTTAIKYGVLRKTLENRWKGKTVSIQDTNSQYHQALTNAQEKALIGIINNLTNRNMPPTSAIVKNLVEEIRGGPVGKNWTSGFLKRHKDELRSQYLSNIDNKRVKGEFPPVYEEFFKLVECYFALLWLLSYLEPC